MRRRNGWFKRLGMATLLLIVSGWSAGVQSAGESATGGGVSREQALQVFERMKTLAGDWDSVSTKGWEGAERYTVIARGSVILVTEKFKNVENDGMATAIHMDGDRLLLTHYCEAKNQPRLVLSSVEDGGRTAIFTFLDGTNMASRDNGHMDKVVIRFQDGDRYSSQWTWYQKGKETWMEEITSTRIHEHSQR